MQIEYDGSYPNLCSGKLVVIVDGKRWEFPSHSLCSGGSVSFDENWSEIVTSGEWSISMWPENFPDELKQEVIRKINDEIHPGCCGGCV